MNTAPDLHFIFQDGREICIPPPGTAQLASVRLIAPPAGVTEHPRQFIARITRQVDTMLAHARWHSAPAARGGDPCVRAAQLTLSDAVEVIAICVRAAVGIDDARLHSSLAALTEVARFTPLAVIPLGELPAYFPAE
jgi:hypothetical protein